MKFNIPKITLGLIVLMFAMGILAYPYLPDSMPSHWNTKGEVDGHMDKFWGTFLFPFLSVFLIILFKHLPKMDPLKKNYKEFEKEYKLMINVITFYFFYIMLLVISFGLGYEFSMTYAMIPGMAMLFYVIGVIMEKAKRNWFVGIRNPWTLSSDKVWEKTHKKAAVIFKASALMMTLGFFFEEQIAFFMVVPLLLGIAYLMLYSYLEYKKEKKK